MNSDDIYHTLKKYPHNNHYLKRYFNFILACQLKNKNSTISNFEKHHICPQGKNFFPEYKNFKQHPWNCSFLTYRQHYIAHYMLAKAYGGYAWNSFYMLVSCIENNKNIHRKHLKSYLYEISKEKYPHLGPSKETQEKLNALKKGKTNYKNLETGDIHQLHKDDPKIEELGLVGITKGTKTNNKCNKNYVTCKDKYTGEKLRVAKEEFENSDHLVGVMSGVKPAVYNKKKLIGPSGDKIMCDPSDYDHYIKMGYESYSPMKGTSNETVKNTVWLNDGIKNYRVYYYEIENYLKNGCVKGRLPIKRDNITCPYCGKSGVNIGGFKKHHFKNCKIKPTG